jgi:hypothetical protein
MDSNSSTPTTRGGWLRAILGPLIFVSALGAAHYAMTVPKSDMIARKKKGKKDKKAKKKKGKEYPAYDRWRTEKRDDAFVRIHEPVMRFAVDLAQAAVFREEEGKPESFLRSVKCQRWHCQYKLCGERQDLSDVVRTLKRLEHEDDVLFDTFETKTGNDKAGDHCTRAIVRFSRPSPEVKGIRVDKKALKRVHRAREARHKAEAKARERKAGRDAGFEKKKAKVAPTPKVVQEPKTKKPSE